MFSNQTVEVGIGFGKKSLAKALELVEDGETIIIHPGYYPEPKKYAINKNIRIIGRGDKPEKVRLNCAFEIAPDRQLTMEYICMECTEEATMLLAQGDTKVELKHCIVRDSADFKPVENLTKFRVYAYRGELNMRHCDIRGENGTDACICYNHARGELKDCYLQGIWGQDHADLVFSNIHTNTVLALKESSKLQSTGFLKVDSIDDRYAFYLKDGSQMHIENVGYERGLQLSSKVEDSLLHIRNFHGREGDDMQIYYNLQSEVEANSPYIQAILNDPNAVVQEAGIAKQELYEKEEEAVKKADIEKAEVSGDTVDYMQQLQELYGIEKVKKKVKEFVSLATINQKRKEMGYQSNQINFHSVFLGNPGTGKTTVARILGKLLYQYYVISSDVFVEVAREDLVAEYVGQTAPKTKKVLDSALGGILFIDEAYTLYHSGGNDFGKEAVDTILKFMEDHKGEIMIIFAGYTNEMRNFLNMNPGLKSRVPNEFEFEDYTPADLGHIGYRALTAQGYTVDEMHYKKALANKYRQDVDKSNARFARNFNEQILLKQALRISQMEDPLMYMNQIVAEDIFAVLGENGGAKEERLEELLQELDGLIGLAQVKKFVADLLKQAKTDKQLEALDMDYGKDASYHMLFTGNPGTGKTTIARIIAEIFYNLDILTHKNVVEVSRPDLVGSHIGETEVKTREAITSAMGGVLFIDEAYQLSHNGMGNDFGKEAIETLLTALENYRKNFIAIFAGYTDEMEEFLDTNPGLRSRVPITIEFPDYTPEEIGQIVKLSLEKKWKLGLYPIEERVAAVYRLLDEKDKANARWARNLSEEVIRNHKIWLVDHEDYEDLLHIDETVLENTILSKLE